MKIPLIGRTGINIRALDGCVESGFPDMLSTPLYYKANPGDMLVLSDISYQYNVATYRPEIEERWIYTYDYAPEQSWTVYNQDLCADSYRQNNYIFDDSLYFRICLRKADCTEFIGTEDINDIISFESSIPTYLEKSWLADEIRDTARRAGQFRTKSDKAFIIITDSHYNVNGTWDDTKAAIAQLCRELKPDGIIHLGDLTDGMVTGDATRHYAKSLLSDLESFGIPVMFTAGNHDWNYFRNNPDCFTASDMNDIYFSGGDVRHYTDYTNLRLIFIDSFDPHEQFRYGYSQECIRWLSQTLSTMPPLSKAIIFSHLPPLTRLQYWTKTVRGDAEIIDILKHNSTKILAWINGHNHADRLDNGECVPIVSIANAKCEAFTERKPEGFITPDRKLGNRTQELFDIHLINADNTIRFIRFGAGRDRIIENGKARWL